MSFDFDFFIKIAGTLLLGGNAYFIKRLIDKVERTSDLAIGANGSIDKLSKDVNALGTAFRDLKTDMKIEFKEFKRIEIDVGIIKHNMGLRNNKGTDA